MSAPIPIPGPSEGRGRLPAGNRDNREGLGVPDPEDLEIAPSSPPAPRVLTHGQ